MKSIRILAFILGTFAFVQAHAQGAKFAKLGGFVIDPASYQGSIVFVNAQTSLDEGEIKKVISNVVSCVRYNIKVVKGAKPAALPSAGDMKAAGGTVAVFVVEDNSLPPLLVAPEERWAMVNVGKLKAGLNDDVLGKRMFTVRARGELLRAFLMATGCARSQYNNNLLDITKVGDLDTRNPDDITYDAIQRSSLHLKNLGVTPERRVMYIRACREGWAPAPTNDVQKAIWDKVHALPTQPIKIKPETKRVTE